MRKTLAVALKELRQILRDRRSLLILLFVPAFFLLLYGYALNFDIRNVKLAVQDQDRSAKSRELVSSFVNSGYFSLVGYVDSPSELDRLVDEGRVRAILSIPSGFEHDLSLRQPVKVQVIIDGDNANTASTVTGYARNLINAYSAAVSVSSVRPPADLRVPVPSIDAAGNEVDAVTKGRHDPCVGIRGAPVVEAMVALVLADHKLLHRGQCGESPQ